jgi:hypothetical protein
VPETWEGTLSWGVTGKLLGFGRAEVPADAGTQTTVS